MNIEYPFQFDETGRSASTTSELHIRQMIEQFLFTNSGERVNRPEFGSGVMQLTFAPNSTELASTLQFTIQAGLQQWLGDLIEVQSLEVRSKDASLLIEVVYSLRGSGENRTVTFVRGDTNG